MPSAQEWDERFLRGDHSPTDPDSFIVLSRKYWDLMRPDASPTALDVACGAGRHAVWLAEAGFSTTGVDFSPQGLGRARQLAEARGVDVSWVEYDLEQNTIELGDGIFDLAAIFFFLHRPLLPRLARCLRSGGLLVYKTYSQDQLRFPGGPRDAAFLLETNELLHVFRDFRVLVYEEEREGKGTASLIAQKP